MSGASSVKAIDMAELGVNIDHVATLRQARGGIEPDPVLAAVFCESAGADSIVAHLREDRRHINENDVFLLRKALKTKLNLEMSIAPQIVDIACQVRPGQATLVPEKRQELTTEGGIDAVKDFSRIKKAITKLTGRGIAVSLFIDPDKKQLDAAKRLGVKFIELHTGNFALAKNELERQGRFLILKNAVAYGMANGLRIFAGHGLNYANARMIARIKGVEELNIGHAVISRAVIVGLGQAVREMKDLIK